MMGTHLNKINDKIDPDLFYDLLNMAGIEIYWGDVIDREYYQARVRMRKGRIYDCIVRGFSIVIQKIDLPEFSIVYFDAFTPSEDCRSYEVVVLPVSMKKLKRTINRLMKLKAFI